MQSFGTKFGVDHSRELTHTAGLVLGLLALIDVFTGLAFTRVSGVAEKRRRRESHTQLSKYMVSRASSLSCHGFVEHGKQNCERPSSNGVVT